MESKKVVFSCGDGILHPVVNRLDKVMITLSGSEGGIEHADKCARFLQDHGVPALALGYFKTRHSNRYLSCIPLELIGEVISWLQEQGYQQIGIQGASKGAEYAAAAAIEYESISCVILKTPSYFYSEGMFGKIPSNTSCWSYQQKEIPYTPYKTRKLPVIQEILKHREYNILQINTGKKINDDSFIPIEQIKAPILMFSTSADTIWPSEDSCIYMHNRLRKSHFSYPFKHINYQHMSHMMLEYCGSSIRLFIKSERQFPQECRQERENMGNEMIHWIEEVW